MHTSLWVTAILLATALAGCASKDTGDGGDTPPPPPPPLPYSQFRCADGILHRGDLVGNVTRCNVKITGNAPRNNGPGNELTIAVDPTNPLRLTAGAKDYTLGPDDQCGQTRVWAGTYWSADGGYNWSNELMPGHDKPVSDQSSNPLAGYHCTSDPVVFWDNHGNAYYSGLSYAQQSSPAGDVGSNLWVAKSTNGGAAYSQIKLAHQGDGLTVFHDKQWLTADAKTGNIYLTWSMFVFPLTDQIVFSKSTDGGLTWSSPYLLYETGAQGAPQPDLGKQFSMPQVDKDGNLYVIWMGNREIWFTKSADQGTTWSPAKTIQTGIQKLTGRLPPTEFRAFTYPILAVDRSSNSTAGYLYVTYAALSGNKKSDVFLTMSKDKGATWSAPLRVNDDNTTTDQFMPWIDVGPQGDVHVAFFDRRNDANNTLFDLYYAHGTTTANGTIFDPNLRVSEVLSSEEFSFHQSGSRFIGDYIGVMEGSNGWVHPIWVDTRHGRADVYTATIVRS